MSDKETEAAWIDRVENLRATISELIGNQAELIATVTAAHAKIARLREALKPFANRVPTSFMDGDTLDSSIVAISGSSLGDFRRARSALDETK
jgi:hypothetical protein